MCPIKLYCATKTGAANSNGAGIYLSVTEKFVSMCNTKR